MGTFKSHTTPVYKPTAVAASGVITTQPSTLIGIWARNTSANTRYLFLFDSATVPADGSVPTGGQPIELEAGTSAALVPPGGMQFDSGIAWCTSSTDNTKTVAAAEMWVTATYRALGGKTT